ncbi:MAG TPA: site-specific integrase [Gammaproteobacteria bacterium]|nr:site-specific integrase [Gammaproteobacteria bacterium]
MRDDARRRNERSTRALTVREAVESYLADRDAEGQDTARARAQLKAHVLPAWGARRIADLTAAELKRWRDALVETAPRRRRSRGSRDKQPASQANAANRPDARRRRSTVNRITTIFKAALSHAALLHPGTVPNDAAWRVGLRAFRNVDAPRTRWLTRSETIRLIAACPPDFGRLVHAAVYTGCRYGELCRAVVGDYDAARRTLHVPVTKSGRARDVFLNKEGARFFASITDGRASRERLLPRTGVTRGGPGAWGPSYQARRMADACRRAVIHPPISFHGLRHTYASLAVAAGMPLLALARNLGHADTRMVERHYGHLSDGYIRRQVNRFAPGFGRGLQDR